MSKNETPSKNGFVVAMQKTGHWIRSLFTVQDGKEPKMLTLYKKNATKSIISSVICILAGILVGFLFMIIISLASDKISVGDSFFGLGIIVSGPFTSLNITKSIGNMIFYTVPLIMTGLSVAIAFKTGLFNIGAPGQYLMGTLGSLLVALNIDATGNPTLGFFVWLLALVVGTVMGMLWGCIPGLFKALFNVNEVIVCIMTNWIAANIVSWILTSDSMSGIASPGKGGYLIKPSVRGTATPTWGLEKLFPDSYIDISIVIAILFAIAVYIVLNKTTFGFELKSCGSNKNAAKYAGMNEKRNIILSMAIAGGLAAVGGALYYLNAGIELKADAAYSTLPAYGFSGISAALLANSNPIGVIFSALLLRYLSAGGANLSSAGYNMYIADIIIALIIYFAGFSKFILSYLGKLQIKLNEKTQKKIMQQATANADVPNGAPDAIDDKTSEGNGNE